MQLIREQVKCLIYTISPAQGVAQGVQLNIQLKQPLKVLISFFRVTLDIVINLKRDNEFGHHMDQLFRDGVLVEGINNLATT